jgi:hypothetical protein
VNGRGFGLLSHLREGTNVVKLFVMVKEDPKTTKVSGKSEQRKLY